MAVTGTAAMAAEVKPAYDGEFYLQSQAYVYHDQMCDLRHMMNGQRGSSFNWPIIDSLPPNTAPLDELDDVASQAMRANEVLITLQEFGGAVDISKKLVATSYSDVYKQAAMANGYNLAESFDLIVRAVMGQGSRVFFPSSVTSRSSIDGQGTSAHRMSASFLERITRMARVTAMPKYDDNTLCTIMHPFVHYDLMQDSDIRTMSSRQYPEILFNGEMTYWDGIRIVVSPNAKGLWGQGAAASSPVATTLSAAAAVGANTISVASATNIAVGQYLAIRDAAEPGNTWTDTNELVYVTGVDGTTISVFSFNTGVGDGGLRFAHASGTTVNNSNSIYPVPVLGPNSIGKVCSDLTGPMGETVVTGPFDKLGRFLTFGWYALCGWGRVKQSWLFRGEVGSSAS